MISVDVKEGVMEVTSPYNPEFVDFAHMRNGKWSDEKEVWMFDTRDEFSVRSALIDIYGTDDYENCEKADIRCDFDAVDNGGWIAYIVGWKVAKCRYGEVRLSDRTVLVEGELEVRSNKVMKTYSSDEVIVEVRSIPRKAAEKAYKDNTEKVEIIGGIDEQKLKDERQKLQERIQEINELLETLQKEDNDNGIPDDLKD